MKKYHSNSSLINVTKMKKIIFFLALAATAVWTNAYQLTSPDRRIGVNIDVIKGRPTLSVTLDGTELVRPSTLGLQMADGTLGANAAITGNKPRVTSHDETWVQPWGEDDTVRNHYNEITLQLKERRSTAARKRMDIVVRAYDDGIAFRYVVPDEHGSDFQIMDELTQIRLAHDAQAWSIPSNRTEYFEGIYESSLLSQKDTVCTPLTIEYAPDVYLALHEANLTDYASINLTPRRQDDGSVTLLTALTPWQSGVKVYGHGTMKSPWRTIVIGRTAGDLILSRMTLNLNEPCKIEDTSWIEPGRYLGIWWSIHKKQHTWEMGPDHGATTQNVKRYIDFAARHGFSGVLAEGWNPGWAQGETVTYLQAYPDFDIHDVCRYARERGVRFIGHMESWGRASLIEQQMDSAFAWYNSLGINAVKTGYVGHLLDGKELAKSQYGIRHYRRVIECAAQHHIMIDNHEPAMPTGLQRTWPNLMTQEGVRGQEYNAWSADGGNPPSHTVTLPFTRGLAGPMDFTPAIFNQGDDVVPGTHPHSTLAKQLAEFVVLYSPLQMAADAIENYEGQPAFTFIEQCPTTWSRTLVPHSKIGQYVTVARKERGGNGRWFIGSITDEHKRSLQLPLDFLDASRQYRALIYEDATDADYEHNPYAITFRQIAVSSTDTSTLQLARSGGCAIIFEPIN
ncbi:MAG: glycoside hydrolase family 97 protein [Muribaculaceae bacterium]|nr:glycoside hydrolase family 97 protein [Muribaculaceae bacterium]